MNEQVHPRAIDNSSALDLADGRALRIALVTSSYNYIKDGVALTLNRLVEYLERQDVQVLVIAPVAEKPAFDHCGTVVPVPSVALPVRPEYRLALGLPRPVQRKLQAFQPDIVHIAVPDVLGFRALQFARRARLPVVASYHTRYETYLKHYWYVSGLKGAVSRYLRNFYGACREVYVPTKSTAEALLADGLKDNFRLWPRGVDPLRFHPSKRSSSWRAKYGISADEPVIVQVSRLVREKRLDTLVETMKRTRSLGFRQRWVIVGDGPERAMLEKQMPDAVFTGFLDGEALTEAYASSDIFIFPSDTESFGNVTLEAMASGLPCVCADATGSRSLVVPGETGFLTPIGCAEEFAGHVATLARDPALRATMGAAARERSLGFAWDETMGRILSYYRALLPPPHQTLQAAA